MNFYIRLVSLLILCWFVCLSLKSYINESSAIQRRLLIRKFLLASLRRFIVT